MLSKWWTKKTSLSIIIRNAKSSFVKTSTGFGTGGATYEDVKLMKEVVGDNALVKASGGVRDYATAEKYIKLGASRLGTSSGIEIIKGKIMLHI